MIAGDFVGVLDRSPGSIHVNVMLPTRCSGSLRRRCNSTGVFVGGFPTSGSSMNRVHLGGLPLLHLSRICLDTTRTTTGLKKRRSGTTGCLGRVIRETGPRTGTVSRTSTAMREVVLREEGRVVNRKRHCFSTLHGGRAVIHCGSRNSGKCRCSLVGRSRDFSHACFETVLPVPISRAGIGPGLETRRGPKCWL